MLFLNYYFPHVANKQIARVCVTIVRWRLSFILPLQLEFPKALVWRLGSDLNIKGSVGIEHNRWIVVGISYLHRHLHGAGPLGTSFVLRLNHQGVLGLMEEREEMGDGGRGD